MLGIALLGDFSSPRLFSLASSGYPRNLQLTVATLSLRTVNFVRPAEFVLICEKFLLRLLYLYNVLSFDLRYQHVLTFDYHNYNDRTPLSKNFSQISPASLVKLTITRQINGSGEGKQVCVILENRFQIPNNSEYWRIDMNRKIVRNFWDEFANSPSYAIPLSMKKIRQMDVHKVISRIDPVVHECEYYVCKGSFCLAARSLHHTSAIIHVSIRFPLISYYGEVLHTANASAMITESSRVNGWCEGNIEIWIICSAIQDTPRTVVRLAQAATAMTVTPGSVPIKP